MAEHSNEGGNKTTGFVPAGKYVSSNSNGDAEASFDNGKNSNRRHTAKVVGIIVGIVVILLVCYFVGAFIFSGRFFPNTTINNLDVSMDTSEEAAVALDNSLAQYELTVEGQGLDFTLNAEQAGLALDAETIANNMMSEVNQWLWPVEVFRSHDETDLLVVTYNESTTLDSVVEDKVNKFNESAIQPVNASITYNEAAENYEIVGDSIGTAVDADKVIDVVSSKAIELAPTAELDESVLLMPKITADEPSLIQSCDNANLMLHTSIQVQMADTVMGEVNPALVSTWITFNGQDVSPKEESQTDSSEEEQQGEQVEEQIDSSAIEQQGEQEEEPVVSSDDESESDQAEEQADYSDDEQESDQEESDESYDESSDDDEESTEQTSVRVSDLGIEEAYADELDLEVNDVPVETEPLVSAVLNEDAVRTWAIEVTKNCDTVGTTRTYTRSDGKEITVSGGSYGWYTDTNGLKTLVVDALYAHEGGLYDIPITQTGVVFNGVGSRDWGSRYIDIDLSEQHVYFYDSSGSLIWDSACVSGLPDGKRNTPTGVYSIYSKETDTYLEDQEKTYRTHVNYWMPFNGGVGLHDANWQSSFGGSQYLSTGSHGCVNLPPSAAANLFSLVEVGDPVVCHW